MRRYLCRALTHPYTRAGWLPHSPKVTTMTGMLRRCRVLWDRRKNPYSNEYSTMYSSCGHTAREGGKRDSTAGFANNYQEEIPPLDSLPPSHHVPEKSISCKHRLHASFNQLKKKNQYKFFEIAARSLDISP